MDPRQQIPLPLPMLLPRRAMCSLRGVTSAKRGRWAESGLVWLGIDRLVGMLFKESKKGQLRPCMHRTDRPSSGSSCARNNMWKMED